MKQSLIGLALTLALSQAHAAEQLPDMLVSATRAATPEIQPAVQIDRLDRADIEASNAGDLTSLLNGRAGIRVTDAYGDGSTATIDMRGFGAGGISNTLIMIDGRKLNPASDSAALYLNSVDLDDVAQVEITQGSSGILYGNQAVGGVINVVTRRPDVPVRELRIGGGSYDGYEMMGHVSERLDNGSGYRLRYRQRDTDNYRDHNDARLRNLNLLLDQDHAGGRVFAEIQDLKERVQTPGALYLNEAAQDRRQSLPVFANDHIDTQSRVLRAGLEQRINPHWRFAGELARRSDDTDFVLSFRAFPGSKSTQDRTIWDFNPRLIGEYGDGGAITRWTLGADLQKTDYELNTAFGTQVVDQQILALYGQVILPLTPRWQTTLGVRHAEVDNGIVTGPFPAVNTNLDDAVTVGSAGLSFQADDDWRLFARAEQNYRFAKVDEHTNVVFTQPVGLNNQTGITWESGIAFERATSRAELLLYRLDLRDEISNDAGNFLANINLDKTRRLGALLSAQTALKSDLLIGGSLEYLDAEITDGPHEGSRVPLVAEWQARLFGEYRAPFGTLLAGEVVYVGDRAMGSDFANTGPDLDAFTLVNLSASHEIGPWRLGMRIDNLFDKRYFASGALDFTGQAGVNPAAERHFWLTAGYRYGG